MAPSDSLSTSSSSARQRRKEARPQELLDAALELFVEKGFDATRSEEVAARAGVSKGTLYLYYPSKEELLKAVIRQQLSTEIAEGALTAERFTGPTPQLLLEVLSTWWERIFDSPASGVIKIVFTEVRSFPEIGDFYVSNVIEPGQRAIGGIIQRGIDRGEFRPVHVPTAVQSLVLPLVMLCLHKHSVGACIPQTSLIEPRHFIRSHIELVLNGLRSDESPEAAGAKK